MQNRSYTGRFAPSPTGPLHAGSLVAAMASYLDALAHDGRWLVRIEDIDIARTVPGAADAILETLAALGMQWDGEVAVQSRRTTLYADALHRLKAHVYPCGCSRREIADSRLGVSADGAPVYPGICRNGLAGKAPRAIRLRVPNAHDSDATIRFNDRWLGMVEQHLPSETGDFVLRRADGFWAYQLAVVVDDAAQGITDVVRGADLLGSTARQIYLQRVLGLPTPRYLHVPVVNNMAGEKLSKQTGAQPIEPSNALVELSRAARFLRLTVSEADSVESFWIQAVCAWRELLRRLPLPSGAGGKG
jgi:glutamyl-Q tRNA(Asp) synthetase